MSSNVILSFPFFFYYKLYSPWYCVYQGSKLSGRQLPNHTLMPFLILHFQDSRQNLQAYHKNMYTASCYSCMLCTLRLINARVYALSFVPIWSARVKTKAMHADVAEEVFPGLSANLISPLSEIARNKFNLPSICCKGRIMTKWNAFSHGGLSGRHQQVSIKRNMQKTLRACSA